MVLKPDVRKSKKLIPNPADFHPFDEAAFRRGLSGILAHKPKPKAPKKARKPKGSK